MDKQFLHDISIAAGGLAAVFPLLAYAMRAKGRRLLLPLIGLFDGQVGALEGTFDWTLRGRFKRRPVRIAIGSVGMSGARSVRLEVICSAAMRFRITRRHLLASALRTLGMPRDLEIGDEFLDSEYAFRATAPARFAPWVKRMDIRRHIEALFDDGGMEHVSLDGGELRCGYTTGQFVMPAMGDVHRILEALTALAESLEAQHEEKWVLGS